MPPTAATATTSNVAKRPALLPDLPPTWLNSCIAGSFRGFRVITLSRKDRPSAPSDRQSTGTRSRWEGAPTVPPNVTRIAASYSVSTAALDPHPTKQIRCKTCPHAAMLQRRATSYPCCPKPRTRLQCYDRWQKRLQAESDSEVFRGPRSEGRMGEPIDMEQSGCLYHGPTC
jgi:hypothetical protein